MTDRERFSLPGCPNTETFLMIKERERERNWPASFSLSFLSLISYLSYSLELSLSLLPFSYSLISSVFFHFSLSLSSFISLLSLSRSLTHCYLVSVALNLSILSFPFFSFLKFSTSVFPSGVLSPSSLLLLLFPPSFTQPFSS